MVAYRCEQRPLFGRMLGAFFDLRFLAIDQKLPGCANPPKEEALRVTDGVRGRRWKHFFYHFPTDPDNRCWRRDCRSGFPADLHDSVQGRKEDTERIWRDKLITDTRVLFAR